MAVLDDHIRLPLNSIVTSLGEDGLGLASPKAVALWPGGRIPYQLPPKFDYQNEWKVMVETWGRAGIQWVPRSENDRNYVFVQLTDDPSACGRSMIGMVGGPQLLTLKPKDKAGTCPMQTVIIHEAGHAMGFLHEQQRSDRDAHVTFDLSKIKYPAGMTESRKQEIRDMVMKQSNKIDGTENYGAYDINSIMHYSSSQTYHALRTKNGGSIQNALTPSELDIASAKQAYSKAAASPSPNTCGVIGLRQNILYQSVLSQKDCASKCSELETTDPQRRCVWNSHVFRPHPEKNCLVKNGSQTIRDQNLTTLITCEVLSNSLSRYYPKLTANWGEQKVR